MHGVTRAQPVVPVAWAALVAASVVGMFTIEGAVEHVARPDGLWALARCTDRDVHALALALGCGGVAATLVFGWWSWSRGPAHRAPALLIGPAQAVAVVLVALVRPAADCTPLDVVQSPLEAEAFAGPLIVGLCIALFIGSRIGLLKRDSGLPFGGTSGR